MSCNSGTKQKKEEMLAVKKIPKVVTSDIEAGIKANIAKKVEEGGGYFNMSTEDRDLRLKLVRVHTEYLSNLGLTGRPNMSRFTVLLKVPNG